MGLFCVNFHFRTKDEDALRKALGRRGVTSYLALPAKGGWTSLYEERASEQDDSRIHELAGGLSKDLRATAIAFLVHDSDIACYWLFDQGRLLDEYNSSPSYFDDGGSAEPSGGRPDLLLPHCRAGVTEDELEAILVQDTVFAENVIEQLAGALGIDVERALTDYRDMSDGGPGFGGFDDGGDDDDDDGDGGGPSILPIRSAVLGKLSQMFGGGPSVAVEPQAAALVAAASADDADEIDRLLAQGVDVDAEAPAPLTGEQPLAGLGQLFPAGAPQLAMTPLLTAILHKRRLAAARLLEGGADPNRLHPLLGTPVHAATGAGEAELLQLLIDRGGDVTAPNRHGQTPLQVVSASRMSLDRLSQAQAQMKSLGFAVPGLVEHLSAIKFPTEGWTACEQLLRAHGAR